MGDLLHFTPGPRHGLRRGTSATSWYAQACALEASDPPRAIACYERALAGRPDFADAHNNLGRVIHEWHERDEAAASLAVAESCYRLAICAAPDVALYWFNLGVSVEDQGRTSEAMSCYERALSLDPQLADAHYNVARLLEHVGRSTANELVLRRAVRHLVRYKDLVSRLGVG